MFASDGVRRLVLTAGDAKAPASGVEMVALQRTEGQIEPAAILAALSERGFKRILIEGGADTVSRFIAAKCLDRLHVVVAPMILGSGRTGISLPPIETCDEALRVPMHVHLLDDEVLYDCDFSASNLGAQRIPRGGFANRSR
jgi:riboflavin biosynthesis pyrimidine reductase